MSQDFIDRVNDLGMAVGVKDPERPAHLARTLIASPLDSQEAAIIGESAQQDARVLVEGGVSAPNVMPVVTFDRCDTFGTITDTIHKLEVAGFRTRLVIRNDGRGDLFAEAAA